jgi:hypothetical protein
MSEDKRTKEKAPAAMSVAGEGKFKPACDRIVAASRYGFNSAAAVIMRKIDGGNVVQNPLTLVN